MNHFFKTSLPKFISVAVLAALFSVALPKLSYSQNANQPTFNHAALCATNLKKTTEFYKTVMQLQVIANPFHDTTHTWFKIGPGLALHVIQGACKVPVNDIAI